MSRPPTKSFKAFVLLLKGRYTAHLHTYAHTAQARNVSFMSGEMNILEPSSPNNTLRKCDADSFHFEESREALLFSAWLQNGWCSEL